MTLIAAGQNTRNRAMLGLQAMSQEEAEREALYQQMRQAQKAQNAQLAGTGLGIAGSYAAMNPEKVSGAARSIGQSLGLISPPPVAAGMVQGGGKAAVAAANPLTTQVVGSKAGSDAVMYGGKLFVDASPVAQQGVSAALQGKAGPIGAAKAGALASPVGTTGTAAATTGVTGAGAAGAGATGAGVAGAGATGAGVAGAGAGAGAGAAGAGTVGTATTAAGSLAAIAAPLAIGLGAAFLLSKLFD